MSKDKDKEKDKDAEIVEEVLAGDRGKFTELVDKYKGKITGVVYSYLGPYDDIEGAVQEAFLRGYKQLSTLSNPRQFGSWIMRIARNLCIDKLRKRKDDTQSLEHVEEKGVQIESTSSSPVGRLIEEEDVGKFYEAFDHLDPEYREMLTLKNFVGLSYKEISKVTGLSTSKIGELLYKARKQLKLNLKKLARGQEL